MITLNKVRGKANEYRLVLAHGGKTVSWPIDGDNVSVETLLDVVSTAEPNILPTVPAINLQYPPLARDWNTVTVEHNVGAEAADKAARAEEQRLMNMGSALAKGINMGPEDIPVFNDPGDLPEPNWGV